MSNNEMTLEQLSYLSKLKLDVVVEFGKLSVSAEELLDLMQGERFSFEFNPLSEVSLRVSDFQIAKGRFVLVDGALAIEVTKSWQDDEFTEKQKTLFGDK